MSGWDQYINFLLAENKCQTAIILGKANGAIWASSVGIAQLPSYQIEVEGVKHNVNETDLLLKAVNNKGVPTDPNVGLRINNEKYYTVRFDAETGTWYLKKDQGGACIAITHQTIIVGTFNSTQKLANGVPQNPGATNAICEKLQQLLQAASY